MAAGWRLQELLGGVGTCTHGASTYRSNTWWRRHEELLGGVQQVRSRAEPLWLAWKTKKSRLQGLLDLALQLRCKLGSAVELAGAVVLNLLVGLVAVQLGDSLAAVDLVGQIVESELARARSR